MCATTKWTSTVRIKGFEPNFPVGIEIRNGPKAWFIDITKQSAMFLVPFLSHKPVLPTLLVLWTGPTGQHTNVRFLWLSTNLVGITIFHESILPQDRKFGSQDGGLHFEMDSNSARSLSQKIDYAISNTPIQDKVTKVNTPIITLPDPLANAKKRMDDNLRGVFT